MKHLCVGVFVLAFGVVGAASAPANGIAVADCQVTATPQRALKAPVPYPADAPYANFWHGNERLWTILRPGGTWERLPLNERGYRQKIFWWYPGFDGRVEARPDLKVFGRRLDGPESFVSGPATNAHHPDFGGWTILTAIDVPTTGCWELTGTYRGESVSFVVKVEEAEG